MAEVTTGGKTAVAADIGSDGQEPARGTFAGEVSAPRRYRLGRLDVAVVVACVGAMAAVALPRQWDTTAATRRTEISALADSVRSAARLGHALWQAGGAPDALEVARGRIAIVNGYPAAADLPLLLDASETMAFTHEQGTWRHQDTGRSGACGLRYAPPARLGESPSVQLDVSDC